MHPDEPMVSNHIAPTRASSQHGKRLNKLRLESVLWLRCNLGAKKLRDPSFCGPCSAPTRDARLASFPQNVPHRVLLCLQYHRVCVVAIRAPQSFQGGVG